MAPARSSRIRLSSWLILAAAVVAGFLTAATEFGGAADRALDPLRFAAVHRTASGRVTVVEMDAASAATIKRWPWSRTHYAQVVDALRRAGAASIVFDVDFSSPSDPAGDRSFADALARADGLVALPTFGQQASTSDRRTIDALPIALLRPHVALASVSIAPDVDGAVRAMPFGTMTAGVPRPSLTAYIAARSGAADATFPIDMSIDPATIPRLSFVAARDGRFDPKLVRGRNVLIGATAIEMGDRYGTPVWGVIPGVIVQALAAETLLRGVPVRGSPLLPLALALAAAALMLRITRAARIALGAVAALAVLSAAVLVAQHTAMIVYPLAPALAVLFVAVGGSFARAILARFATQRATDEATGLPNRRALVTGRRSDWAGAVAVAQIGNFDQVLAVLGNAAATDAVGRMAERLRLSATGAVYRIDDRHLAFGMDREQGVEDALHGLRNILLQPVEVAGRRIDIAVTIGLADGDRALDQLLSDATMAAERAQQGGDFWARAATDRSGLERSISLMGELDQALAAGQLQVHYQPKYNVAACRVTSVEALVRWPHPERGNVGPDVFVTLAEQTDRIAPLTLYVFDQVLADLAAWQAAGISLTAAVNISAKLLSSNEFNASIEARLAASAVPTSALVFEVTESAAMSDPKAAIAALQHYRALGVAVSMDDYGTGQCTLTYLRQLPLNELKIDRSFVQHAHQNRNDGLLVRSTIDLAHDLGLKVVAEGVEDPECLAFLAGVGCDMIQGYLISKPLPAPALLDFITAGDPVAKSA